MNISHPLSWISSEWRVKIFFLFTVFTFLAYLVFLRLDAPLRNRFAPAGIVSFELAGSAQVAQSIINSWDNEAKLNASFGLGFDFLFMPFYAVSIGMGILLGAKNAREPWGRMGGMLGWFVVAAVIFDCIENVVLFSILRGNFMLPPVIAAGCAYAKFGILICGLIYTFAGLFETFRNRMFL